MNLYSNPEFLFLFLQANCISWAKSHTVSASGPRVPFLFILWGRSPQITRLLRDSFVIPELPSNFQDQGQRVHFLQLAQLEPAGLKSRIRGLDCLLHQNTWSLRFELQSPEKRQQMREKADL